MRDIIVPEDRELWDRHDKDAYTGMNVQEIQVRIRTRDGVTRWIEHGCQPVYTERGEFLGTRASNRDISDRKKAEEALRESEATLKNSKKDRIEIRDFV